MIAWLRPRYVLPVHGDVRQLNGHAELARSCGSAALVVNDGDEVRLAPGEPAVLGQVPCGRLAVSGARPVPLDTEAIQARRRMMFNGAATVLLVLDADGEPSAPAKVILRGLDLPEGAAERIRLAAEARVVDLPRARRGLDEEVNLAVRQAIRGELKAFSSQRPAIDIEIVRLPAANALSYAARRGVR